MGDHRTFAQDTRTAVGTPILGTAGTPAQKSEVQDKTSSGVAALPTHRSPSRPSFDHIQSTNPAQPVQGTCSAGAGKVGKSSLHRSHHVEIVEVTTVSSLDGWEGGCVEQGEVGSNSLADIQNCMASSLVGWWQPVGPTDSQGRRCYTHQVAAIAG